jgi:hypothetical protein
MKMHSKKKMMIGDSLLKGCYGTKEYTLRSGICLTCGLYISCGKLRKGREHK